MWDIAARISYQIETCTYRLEQTCDGYTRQLGSLLARKGFTKGSRIDDIWSQSVYLAIQAFLTDACVLRNYLAEFAAEYVYQYGGTVRIRTLANLIKLVIQKEMTCDSLTVQLRNATAPGGWLAVLGLYRDLIVHSAPLALAKNRLWVRCETIGVADAEGTPAMRFPLPGDPGAIMSARSSGNLFHDFATVADQFSGAADADAPNRDALEYMHDVFGDLVAFALELGSYSPLSPEMPVLTDRDLKGPIQWNT